MPIETPYKSLHQLESELLEYGQAYAFGDIDKPEFERAEAALKSQIFERLKAELCALDLQALGSDKYYAEKKRIQQAMEKVDTRPNCTFSEEPKRENQPAQIYGIHLKTAKNKLASELDGMKVHDLIDRKQHAQLIERIRTARTIEEVKAIADFRTPKK